MSKPNIEKTSWNEIKHLIQKLNPKIFEIMDEISPDDDLEIIRYNYGDLISDDKYFYKPDYNNGYTKVDSNKYPYMIILSKTMDLFLETKNYIFPEYKYKVGEFMPKTLSLSRNKYKAKPDSAFNLTAGIHTLISLPLSYASKNYYEILRKYNLDVTMQPTILPNHFKIFSEIVKKEKIDWQLELLVFPLKWADDLLNNPKWSRLKFHILEESHKVNSFKHNSFYIDYAMQEVIDTHKISLSTISLNMLKRIFLASTGDIIGYKPLVDNDDFPLDEVTEIFFNLYNQNTTPIFMGGAVNEFDSKTLYLPFSALNKVYPDQSRYTSHIQEVSKYLPLFLDFFSTSNLTAGTIYNSMKDNLKVDFYTERGNLDHNIKPITDLLVDDIRFSAIHEKYKNDLKIGFSKRNPFLKALVGVKFLD